MKKIVSIVLALAMIMMVAMASAATIAVKDVLDGETYTAYKILNYRDNGKTGDDRAVSYYLTSAQYTSIGAVLKAAGFDFTPSSDGTEYWVNNAETVDVAGAAAYLGAHTSDLGSALGTETATGEGGVADFGELPIGYYFVSSTAGSLCALHEESDITTVVEKNTIPTIDKKEKVAAGESFVDGPIDANIGDTVNYQIVITDGTGTDAAITMTDTMTAGLDYKTGSIKINGTAVADDADTDNWKVTVSGRVITIVFSSAYVAGLAKDATITVTYDATINEDAVVNSATGNENLVELAYSAQHQEDRVYVETYDFQVKKTDGKKFLDGAEFKLYDQATGGNQIILSKDDTGYYKDDSGSADTTIDINDEAGCNVRGLAPGTYYLEEVVVPGGYNKLEAREAVTVEAGQTETVEITVINNPGAVLPSTGGIGTTIFYIVGGLLLVGAAVILVARRKAQD